MLVSVSSRTTFERQSMFQRRENHVLKGATIKERMGTYWSSMGYPSYIKQHMHKFYISQMYIILSSLSYTNCYSRIFS